MRDKSYLLHNYSLFHSLLTIQPSAHKVSNSFDTQRTLKWRCFQTSYIIEDPIVKALLTKINTRYDRGPYSGSASK